MKRAIQEENNHHGDCALQNIGEPNRNENTMTERISEQTSVMKPILTNQQGYVHLHSDSSPQRVVSRLSPEGQIEKQVALTSEDDPVEGKQQSNVPLIPANVPQNPEESHDQNRTPPPQTGSYQIQYARVRFTSVDTDWSIQYVSHLTNCLHERSSRIGLPSTSKHNLLNSFP